MAYILAVNPAILGITGMDKGALFATTAITSGIAMLYHGALCQDALRTCTGYGYQCLLCLYRLSFDGAYLAVCADRSALGRSDIYSSYCDQCPRKDRLFLAASIQKAIGVGIGLFIAFIGLQNAGISVKNDATLVALGQIFQPSVLLVIVGLISTAVLLVKNIPGALLIGIAITTICGIPFGLTHLDGFVSTPPSVEPIFMKFEWHNIFTVDMVMVVFSFLFMDLFDTLGTLVSLLYKGGFVKDGKMPRMKESFFADAVGTTIGACMGTSAISTYVESAAGVSVGGRSGLTAFVIAVCFFLSLFFAPLFLSIPAQATAPVLILVGFLMISCIKEIDLDDYAEAIPAFICIITIPLTYSIANGIVFGLLSYVLINLISGKFKKIRIEMYLLSVFFIVMLLLH